MKQFIMLINGFLFLFSLYFHFRRVSDILILKDRFFIKTLIEEGCLDFLSWSFSDYEMLPEDVDFSIPWLSR
jgi:hypothetical protein